MFLISLITLFTPSAPFSFPSSPTVTHRPLKVALTSSTLKATSQIFLNVPPAPLSTTTRPISIAIAGGGVGGLTTAYAMLKKGIDVTIYERTSSFARFGGPIQFASNALSVIKQLDDDLYEQVMEKFTFTGTRACGIKDGLRAKGFRMTNDRLDYVLNEDAPSDWFVKFPLKECADLYGLPYTGVIDRPDLQEILLKECEKMKPGFIKNGNAVVNYENGNAANGIEGVEVILADGQKHVHDALIGSDGIWSSVRAQMYNEKKVSERSGAASLCDRRVRATNPLLLE